MSEASREKFSWICVEINLKKPLIPLVIINRHKKTVEYEGLHSIYFDCRQYGHRVAECSRKFNLVRHPDIIDEQSRGDKISLLILALMRFILTDREC